MSSPVFHIGFPKSGSTFLQRQVFPFLDNYAYRGVHTVEDGTDLHTLLNRFHINLFKTDGLNFDFQECIKDKDEILAREPKKPALFSYEYAVGVLFGYPDAATKAERLAKTFGKELKIIMITREQSSILSSQYRDHPFEPYSIHHGKPVSFEKWYRQTNSLRFFQFTNLVHYDRLIEIYDELFGEKNVLVLPIELMSNNPDLYAKRMGEFLKVDEGLILENLKKPAMNTGHSAGVNRLRKLRRRIPIPIEFSKILPTPIYSGLRNLIIQGKQEKVFIPDALKEEINARYAASNKRLEKRMNISLEPLGYAVDEEDDSELETTSSPYGTYTGYKSDRAIIQTKKFGAHTRPELSMVLSFMKEGDTVLDIGAHIGTFAIPMKTTVGSKGKLFAFEANPKTAELLKKNLQDNKLDAVVFNNGVSEKAGSLFIQERKNKYKSSGSDYLVTAPSEDSSNSVEVQLVKVDDVVSESVDFIKVDVEGMEIDVLKSAEQTIDKYHPIIYSEYVEGYLKRAGSDPKDFRTFFKKHNYHFFINAGQRNAANDDFELTKVPSPQYIRGQVDFLMIHKDSQRYPTDFSDWYKHAPFKFLWNRFRNLLKDTNAKLKLKK